MRKYSATRRQHSAQFEDIVLAVLGSLAGPLLLWMAQTWQHNPAATSVQTMEYWIALLCGFLGIGLCTIWGVFLLAGLGFAIAVKTKNKVVGYWSGLFTPKFLQRIIVSIIGIQLTFSSQAFATEATTPEPTEIASTIADNPFMPELAEMSAATNEEAHSSPAAKQSSDEPSPRSATSKAPPTAVPDTQSSAVAPQPRKSSQLEPDVVPEATGSSNGTEIPVQPTPRQTTTISVPQDPMRDTEDQETTKPGLPGIYLPQKPVPSPYIATPNPDRSPEEPTFVVQTGDSLWDIAHQELGSESTLPQIDLRWRQWWQHNIDVIGKDPHVLSPGTVLKAPPFTH